MMFSARTRSSATSATRAATRASRPTHATSICQNGWEKAMSGALCWAAGFDMFGQAGFVMDGFSLEQLVLDDESLGMLQRVGEGVIVDDDTLAST